MSPLRFRAWHVAENKMYFSELHENRGTSFNFYDWGNDSKLWELELNKTDERLGIVLVNSSNGVLMQSTQLIDKNGKEIYEGDIIQFPVEEQFQRVHGRWARHEIIYRNGRWITSYLASETGAVLPRGYTAGELTYYCEYEDKDIYFYEGERYSKTTLDIIGNIYENPEFLPSAA